MTVGRSLLWFIIGVVWVCAAFAIVYAHDGNRHLRLPSQKASQSRQRLPRLSQVQLRVPVHELLGPAIWRRESLYLGCRL
jgi:hypothetical protein